MKVRMLDTQPGSPDGHKVIWYRQGQVYDLPLALASEFLVAGWAEEVPAEVAPELETPKREYKPLKTKK